MSSTSLPSSGPVSPKNPPVNSDHFICRVKETSACRRCGNVFHKAKDCSAPVEFVSDAPTPGKKNHCLSLFSGPNINEDRAWLISTSASCHICIHRDYFSTYEPVEEYIKFMLGPEGRVIGVGTVVLKLVNGNTLVLRGVRHVPNGVKNIISPFLIGGQIHGSNEGTRLIYDGMILAEATPDFKLLVDHVVTN